MVIINNKVMEEELVNRINELISGVSSRDIKSVKECYALYKDKFDLIDTSTRLRIEEALGICPSRLSDSIKPERLEGESVYEYKWRRKVVERKTNPKYRKVMVATRKEGRWVHCRRVENAAAREALAWLDGYLGNEGRAAADRRRLAAIRRRFEEAPCPA